MMAHFQPLPSEQDESRPAPGSSSRLVAALVIAVVVATAAFAGWLL